MKIVQHLSGMMSEDRVAKNLGGGLAGAAGTVLMAESLVLGLVARRARQAGQEALVEPYGQVAMWNGIAGASLWGLSAWLLWKGR
jgi:hypothetical protein